MNKTKFAKLFQEKLVESQQNLFETGKYVKVDNPDTRWLLPLFAGWMMKRGSLVKNWKKRWFILNKDGMLYYLKNPKTTSTRGKIKVKGARFYLDDKKPNCIRIERSKGDFYFVADNSVLRDKWLEKLAESGGSLVEKPQLSESRAFISSNLAQDMMSLAEKEGKYDEKEVSRDLEQLRPSADFKQDCDYLSPQQLQQLQQKYSPQQLQQFQQQYSPQQIQQLVQQMNPQLQQHSAIPQPQQSIPQQQRLVPQQQQPSIPQQQLVQQPSVQQPTIPQQQQQPSAPEFHPQMIPPQQPQPQQQQSMNQQQQSLMMMHQINQLQGQLGDPQISEEQKKAIHQQMQLLQQQMMMMMMQQQQQQQMIPTMGQQYPQQQQQQPVPSYQPTIQQPYVITSSANVVVANKQQQIRSPKQQKKGKQGEPVECKTQ